eukprot:12667610-Heterocapsa_arctica.AAC.1
MRSSSRTLRPQRGAVEERDLPPAQAAKAPVSAKYAEQLVKPPPLSLLLAAGCSARHPRLH